jgi:hypothetical protein
MFRDTRRIDMARYARFKNGEDRWVWDRDEDVLYAENRHESDEYQVAKINAQQLSKFMPYTKDDGDFDVFPGRCITDEEMKEQKLSD